MVGTLLVVCWMQIGADYKHVVGREIVSKSFDGQMFVAFEHKTEHVRETFCSYVDNPEDVSKHPELYYSKFQPSLSAAEYEVWAANGSKTVAEIVAARGK